MNKQDERPGSRRHGVRRFGVVTAVLAGGLAVSGTGITAGNASPAAAPTMGAQQGGQVSAGDDGRARPRAARAATSFNCTGGATKKSFTGGYNDWLYTSSASWTTVSGTQYRFRVPRGQDTVSVSVAIPEYWITNADYGNYSVLIDGVHMKPGQTWTYADHGSDGSTTQFCKRVGRGWHTVRLVHRVYDGDANGTAWSYLYHPMLHAEVSN